MNKLRGFFHSRKVWKRPFDFYIAGLLFLAGIYSIVNDAWPEQVVSSQITQAFIVIVSIYLMTAAAVIMASLLCKRASRPIFSLMGEMYGWMFVAAGSIATTIMYANSAVHNEPNSWWIWCVLFCVWAGMTAASLLRFFDLFFVYRSLK